MNGIACMGGWCTDRDRCAHHHNTNGTPVFERLCETGKADAFAPVHINRPEKADQPKSLEAA